MPNSIAISLPPRLRALLEMLPPAERVADVGTGHGRLAAHLLRRGVSTVVATDISVGACTETVRNLALWGLAEAVAVRRGEGLQPLARGEVEGAVVAGMGALRLLQIAATARDFGVRWLALQPMQHAELIEPWLDERRWRVMAARTISQGRFTYPTWLVEVPA